AARAVVVEVHARSAELLQHVEDLLPIAEAPEDGSRRAEVEAIRAKPDEMRCASTHLVNDHADELRAAWHVDVADRFHRAGIGVLVQHVRDVVRLIGVPDALVVGAPIEDLLQVSLMYPHPVYALYASFDGELHH